MLEGIFKFWRLTEANTFDIKKHWYACIRKISAILAACVCVHITSVDVI